MKTLAALILCLASVALADDFKTIDGKEYKNVTVSRVEPDGIVVTSKSGILKLYFVELPKEVRERFHYDPEAAQKFAAERAEETKAANANSQELGRKAEAERHQQYIESAADYQFRQAEKVLPQIAISAIIEAFSFGETQTTAWIQPCDPAYDCLITTGVAVLLWSASALFLLT